MAALYRAPRPTMPCFKCGRVLLPVFKDQPDQHQPCDAVTFSASGNYGSTVFDPVGPSAGMLQISICDVCLLGNRDRVWHVGYIAQPPLESFSKPWLPDPGGKDDDED